jgi:hypothetical protein
LRASQSRLQKLLSICLCFLSLCPNSLFQAPIMFSLHLNGSLRRSRWPCQPRTTLRRALPNGFPPGGTIKGNRREITQNAEPDGQTATMHGQTTMSCSAMVRLPTPGIEALGPILGTRGCVCANGGETFGVKNDLCHQILQVPHHHPQWVSPPPELRAAISLSVCSSEQQRAMTPLLK